jgi:hypothetical protein
LICLDLSEVQRKGAKDAKARDQTFSPFRDSGLRPDLLGYTRIWSDEAGEKEKRFSVDGLHPVPGEKNFWRG